MPQVQIHDGGIEQQTIKQVEQPADAGEEFAGIFDAGFAFEKRFDEVADDGRDAEDYSQDDRVNPIHSGHFVAEKMDKEQAGEGRYCDRAAETFPGFAGTDARYHFMADNQRTERIRTGVTELGDENEIEQIVMAINVREEIDFLDKVEQPRDIHETEQSRRNRQDASSIAFRKKLAQTQAEHEQDDEARFEIVDTRGEAALGMVGEIEKRANHQQHPAENAPAFEANQVALFD